MRTSESGGTRATLLAFGHLLKRLRIAADLTQEELAERAMVSARSISDLERGSSHRPRRDTVQLLADGLALSGAEREAFIALARGKVISAPVAGVVAGGRHNLPHPPTAIVGRLKESAAATALVLDPGVRLLTLTGPGGVGKTRLALDVAFRVADTLADGAVFVDLAPVRDPELVISAIAQALGVVASPDVPLRQAVQDALQGKRLLLILDNFEHVPAAAVEVAELLAAAPTVTVLATSRTPLRIRAEREYAIGPLALPEAGDLKVLEVLAQVPAVELFVYRAEAANPGFALTPNNARDVAAVVTRLDGLPLAIELAANRMKILSPGALLARMEQRLPLLTRGAHDLPIRQQAMRATLDWSHDLLSIEEQALFRRLAIFAGGCTVDAAEYVGGDASLRGRRPSALGGNGPAGLRGEVDEPAALPLASPSFPLSEASPPKTAEPSSPSSVLVIDLLADLVDKSLMRTQKDLDDERRFGMLETIREYGLERLVEAGEEDDARSRHLSWSIELAERAEPELLGAEQHQWYSRLAIEHDNLRVALGWAIERGDAEAALRLSVALYRFWANHGLYEEGRRRLERSLALDPCSRSAPRGHALIGLGVMAFFQGDYEWAATLWAESLSLFEALGDTRGVAYSYGNLGLVADAQEDYPRAVASYEQALTRFRALDDSTYIGFMTHNIGLIAYFQGEYARATTLFEESLALARAAKDETSIAMILGNLGLVAFSEGDHARALALQRQALANWVLVNNKPWLARAVEHFALIAAATNDPRRAARLFGAGSALRATFGSSQPPNDRQLNEQFIVIAREQLGASVFDAAWAEGEAMLLEEAIAHALGEDRP
jgi:predicted ATPase/transcriptional regulator with XRE-family HTH domain